MVSLNRSFFSTDTLENQGERFLRAGRIIYSLTELVHDVQLRGNQRGAAT